MEGMAGITAGAPDPPKIFEGFFGRPVYTGHTTMNPTDSSDRLAPLLAEWRLRPPPDPDFRHAVWARLQGAARPSWAGYLRAHLAGWTIAAALAIVAAGWTGHQAAAARLDAEREQMVVSYLGNLDPRVLAQLPAR